MKSRLDTIIGYGYLYFYSILKNISILRWQLAFWLEETQKHFQRLDYPESFMTQHRKTPGHPMFWLFIKVHTCSNVSNSVRILWKGLPRTFVTSLHGIARCIKLHAILTPMLCWITPMESLYWIRQCHTWISVGMNWVRFLDFWVLSDTSGTVCWLILLKTQKACLRFN